MFLGFYILFFCINYVVKVVHQLNIFSKLPHGLWLGAKLDDRLIKSVGNFCNAQV